MRLFEYQQISVSTAQEEKNYFTGQPQVVMEPDPNVILPPGEYRVIDGQLCRVAEGISPTTELQSE